MNSPFAPSNVEFHPVSKKLVAVRYIAALPVPIIALIAVAIIPMPLWLRIVLLCALAAFIIWLLWFIPRYVHFMAWGKTDTDVYIRTGRFFRKIQCAPYGRIQYIDVSSGPLERLFGLAKLHIYTASATGDTTIPGLTMDVAAQLRSDFSQSAREELAGL